MVETYNDINGKLIVLGDAHFGVKKFDIDVLKSQLHFFNNQIIPYMKENNIDIIFQLGDLFDHRTTVDINFFHVLQKEFFDVLKDNNIILHTLVGNHDIYFRESRDVSLVNVIKKLYPDNIVLYHDRVKIRINGNTTYVLPWIVKGEDLTYDEIKDCHTVLGHFEIKHFAMVKGHMNEDAKLTPEFFTSNTNIKNVFSGHYHIKDTKGLIKYLGTPWQINWNDYQEDKGFYVWDEHDYLEFHENTSSKKFIKVKYNDNKNTDRNIEVSGLYSYNKFFTNEEFNEILPDIKKHEVKFFINEAKDKNFEVILEDMKSEEIEPSIIDNQEMSKMIGTDYVEAEEGILDLDSRELIVNAVKEHIPDAYNIILELLGEIDSNSSSID